VFVTGVTASGPAANAGLGQGDVILTVDGKAVEGLSDLYRKVWALGEAGVKVRMSVLQGTQIRRITIDSSDGFRFLKSPPRRKRGTLAAKPFRRGPACDAAALRGSNAFRELFEGV